MKYYIISGETSGDNHASAVIKKLTLLDTNASFRGMGGDASEQAGLQLCIHQKEMAIMGFWEVLINLRKIVKNLKRIKADIAEWGPDVILLVDYPGFNFKIAKYANTLKISVHYYISPKVWAWKESRVKRIKQDVSHLYSILPFEKEYFKKHNVESIYVGNPSKETVDEYLSTHPTKPTKKSIAVLPGSRASEISRSLPIMLDALNAYKEYDILVAQAPGFDAAFYHQYDKDLTLIPNNMYGLLAQCQVAIVTSGTATLETALMGVPQVVCYQAGNISYQIAKAIIKLKYISLVNLILDKPVITELIQDDFNAEQLREELRQLLVDDARKKQIHDDYAALHKTLGSQHPSDEVAQHLYHTISR